MPQNDPTGDFKVGIIPPTEHYESDATGERSTLSDQEILDAHPSNSQLMDQLKYMDSRLKVIERTVRFHLGDPTDPNLSAQLGEHE